MRTGSYAEGRRVWLCALLLLAAYLPALAASELPIATGGRWQAGISVDGDRVVWMERVSHFAYVWQVWTHDFATREHRPLPSPIASAKLYPEASGQICVWEDNRRGNWDIYGYDFATDTEFPVCTDAGDQMLPRISGTRVAWQDNRNGNWDIYVRDLSTGMTSQITSLPSTQYWPDISGNMVVWTDNRRGDWDIYSYDLSSGLEQPVCLASGEQMGVISGDYVVWEDARNGNYDIYLYDLQSHAERRLTSSPADQWCPEIDGDTVVWADFRNENADIFMLNLATGEERQVTTSPANQWYPVVGGGRIFWEDTRSGDSDVYGTVSLENVVEAWRSPLGKPRVLSVNEGDRSCWAAAGASVIHVAADGTILAQVNGFWSANSISADSADGSCWVADTGMGQVVHLRADGTEQCRSEVLPAPLSVSVSPSDGSCWVADRENGKVVKLAGDGTVLWMGTGLVAPVSVGVSATDGSCWVTDGKTKQVAHVASNGALLWQGGAFLDPSCVSVNSADGSCWVVDNALKKVVHLASDGHELWRGGDVLDATSVSVNANDGSCWVADRSGRVLHLGADGTQMLIDQTLQLPQSVSVDPIDGSCWVADFGASAIIRLAPSGDPLVRREGFRWPLSVAANASDDSAWVSDTPTISGQTDAGLLIRLAGNGSELLRLTGFDLPVQVSADGRGYCWVADAGATSADGSIGALALVNETGTELWRGAPFADVYVSLAANSGDNSCWVARGGGGEVLHLSEAGSPLLSVVSPGAAAYVAANSTDGSCWVSDSGMLDLLGQWVPPTLAHFSADGALLWSGSGIAPEVLGVDSTDGSCWVYDASDAQIVHLSEAGAELQRLDTDGYRPCSLSVNPVDGSCWVAETADLSWTGGPPSRVRHFASNGIELWRGSDYAWAVSVSADQRDGSCWVADQYNGQVVRLAFPDSLIATFAASPVSGAAPLTVAFDDESAWYPTAWLWSFGDGSVSTAREPTHVYSKPRYYTVSLQVSNAGGSHTTTREQYICVTFPDTPLDTLTPFWAARQIVACATAGIVGGYPDGLYHPEVAVTRDQMAVFIARALVKPYGDDGIPTPSSPPTFPDVPADYWAYKQIEYCVQQGVVQGYWDGYHPGETVDRAQMAVYAARALVTPAGDTAIPDPPGPPTFADVPATYWAYKWIEYCHDQSIVGGYWDGYHPNETVNRAQMAVYVQRAFDLPM